MGSQQLAAMWLRRPDEVRAHLEFAAEHIQVMLLGVGGRQIFGRFDLVPEGIRFKVHEKLRGLVVPPRLGQPVEARYESPSDGYVFLSEVLEIRGADEWVMAQPNTVERRDRRTGKRIQLVDYVGYEVVVEHPYGSSSRHPISDLGSGGLGLLFDPQVTGLEQGEVFPASVHMPGVGAIAVQIEVRHTRSLSGGEATQAGCRFRRIAYADRMALGRFVSGWGA